MLIILGSWVIFLIAILVGVIGSLLFQMMWDKSTGVLGSHIRKLWYVYLAGLLTTAILVFGVSGFLGQSGLLSKYFEERVSNVIMSTFDDPDFLRELFSAEKLKQLFASTVQALTHDPVKRDGDRFLGVVFDAVRPILDKPIREDYNLIVSHSLINVNGREVLDAYVKIEFTYINPSRGKLQWAQGIQLSLRKIEGIDSLRKSSKFYLDDKECPLSLKKEVTDDRIIYTATQPIDIETKTKVTIEYTALIPKDDFVAHIMSVPTRGIYVKYEGPPQFRPRFYVFGLGSTPGLTKPTTETVRSKEYKYDQLLMPGHGFLLTWMEN